MTVLLDTLAGRRIYLDANVFVYFLDGSTPWAAAATRVLTAARDGLFAAVTGHAAVAEVMVGAYRTRDPLTIRATREFFAQPRLLEIADHPATTWDDTAMVRATIDTAFIDALHLATAAHAGCDAVITNDAHMKPALGVEVIPLAAIP